MPSETHEDGKVAKSDDLGRVMFRHLESLLGKSKDEFDVPGALVRVARFESVPGPGIDTFATVGLSETPLEQKSSGPIRQELVCSVYAKYPAKEVAQFVATVAKTLLRTRHSLALHEVMSGRPLLPGVAACGVLACVPDHLPRGAWADEVVAPPVVVVYLLPLVPPEADYILSHGREAFHDRYDENEPDVWNLDRPPIVTHG